MDEVGLNSVQDECFLWNVWEAMKGDVYMQFALTKLILCGYNCQLFHMVRVWGREVVCGGTGRPTILTPAGYRYALLISRYRTGVAGVVEAVHLYIWSVSKSWNSEKWSWKVMEKSWNFNSGSLWDFRREVDTGPAA